MKQQGSKRPTGAVDYGLRPPLDKRPPAPPSKVVPMGRLRSKRWQRKARAALTRTIAWFLGG